MTDKNINPDFMYEMKIPKDRVAVLIGTKGNVKRDIEGTLGVKLKIDSEEGDVIISCDDSLNLLTAQNIVKAIARGFNPEVAMLLTDENNVFEMIDITDFSGKSKKKLIRLRGRAIGIEGKSRENVEELTGTHIMVFGKTVAIIGDFEHVKLARMAFESLLAGSRHATIYAWLEKQCKELKRAHLAQRFER
jgi:ribosomal RNA assembly protein